MKKFGLVLAGIVAAAVLLANVGPMLALAISLGILYIAFKGFIKAETKFKKGLWGAIGVIVVFAAVSNLPAIIGVLAGVVLYMVYKKWNSDKETVREEADPFKNFEKQWAELNRH
ncbi:flagellar basal body rod protein [Priestia megaterium]|nr:flagellar basal body rod protein [Priestia megaterium]